MTYLRVENKLNIFALSLTYRVMISLIVGALFFLKFELLGLIIGEVLSYLIIIIFLFYKVDFKFKNKITISYFSLMKTGFGFSMSSLTQYLTINIDKWSVALLMGSYIIGIYSFYFIVFSVFLAIANVINQVLIPRWLIGFGSDKSLVLLMVKLKKYFIFSICLSTAFGGGVYFLLSYLMDVFYQDYSAGLPLLPFIIIASVVHVINLFEVPYLAAKKGAKLLSIRLIVLVIVAVLCFIVNLLNLDFIYYAVSFLFGRILTLLLVYLGATQLVFLSTQKTLA
jgi:O-antigen/teichoic acid export membrane protein